MNSYAENRTRLTVIRHKDKNHPTTRVAALTIITS
nr:MAG TPA: hypothetical protein [Caudoviricetes sp.]